MGDVVGNSLVKDFSDFGPLISLVSAPLGLGKELFGQFWLALGRSRSRPYEKFGWWQGILLLRLLKMFQEFDHFLLQVARFIGDPFVISRLGV